MAVGIVRTSGGGKMSIDAPLLTINSGLNLQKGEIFYSRPEFTNRFNYNGMLNGNTGVYTSLTMDGNYLAVVTNGNGATGSPFIFLFKRSGDNLVQLPPPNAVSASPPSGQLTSPTGVEFSPDSNYLACTTRAFWLYERSGDTFTSLTNPITTASLVPTRFKWSPDGKFLAVAVTTTPFVRIYKMVGNVLTAVTTLTGPSGSGVLAWSHDSQLLALVGGGSPFLYVWSVLGETFTRITANVPVLSSTGGESFGLSNFDGNKNLYATVQAQSGSNRYQNTKIIRFDSNNQITETISDMSALTIASTNIIFTQDKNYCYHSVGYNATQGMTTAPLIDIMLSKRTLRVFLPIIDRFNNSVVYQDLNQTPPLYGLGQTVSFSEDGQYMATSSNFVRIDEIYSKLPEKAVNAYLAMKDATSSQSVDAYRIF